MVCRLVMKGRLSRAKVCKLFVIKSIIPSALASFKECAEDAGVVSSRPCWMYDSRPDEAMNPPVGRLLFYRFDRFLIYQARRERKTHLSDRRNIKYSSNAASSSSINPIAQSARTDEDVEDQGFVGITSLFEPRGPCRPSINHGRIHLWKKAYTRPVSSNSSTLKCILRHSHTVAYRY